MFRGVFRGVSKSVSKGAFKVCSGFSKSGQVCFTCVVMVGKKCVNDVFRAL